MRDRAKPTLDCQHVIRRFFLRANQIGGGLHSDAEQAPAAERVAVPRRPAAFRSYEFACASRSFSSFAR